jgi:hypothetical protein
MSDDADVASKNAIAKRVGDIAEGLTFVVFLVVFSAPYAPVLAFGAVWMAAHLGLLALWPGVFTFAAARSVPQDAAADILDKPPRTLTVTMLISLAVGFGALFQIFDSGDPRVIVAMIVLGAFAGSLFFACAHLLDPPIRTIPQMALLGVESILWGIGAVTSAALFFG